MSKATFRTLQETAVLTDDGLQNVTGGSVPGAIRIAIKTYGTWKRAQNLRNRLEQGRPTSNKYHHVGGGRYAIN